VYLVHPEQPAGGHFGTIHCISEAKVSFLQTQRIESQTQIDKNTAWQAVLGRREAIQFFSDSIEFTNLCFTYELSRYIMNKTCWNQTASSLAFSKHGLKNEVCTGLWFCPMTSGHSSECVEKPRVLKPGVNFAKSRKSKITLTTNLKCSTNFTKYLA
jgi:uncharacterized membrane protein YcgQ (UPF0703/DUF1980 family)